MPASSTRPLRIAGTVIRRGASADLRLKISETYTGDPVTIPLRVMRARAPGPTLFVCAGVHGDEVNGIGIVHDLMFEQSPRLTAGTLILIPIVNTPGFEANTRTLPDRRDLNRSFPGSPTGSMAARIAHTLMSEVLSKCDYGIDLHSASRQRTNFPNVRGDFSIPGVRRIGEAFGCELMVNSKGPEGSLRRTACRHGISVVILEAGEPWKFESSVIEIGKRGIENVLITLGMTKGEPRKPAVQKTIRKTTWVRAELGGILRFHVTPGAEVSQGQPLASNYSILGMQQNTVLSPVDGIVLGMTTMPAVKPGEPICHLAVPAKRRRGRAASATPRHDRLHRIAQRDLATSILTREPDELLDEPGGNSEDR